MDTTLLAADVVFWGIYGIVCDVEVQMSIVIDICEGTTGSPVWIADTSMGCYVCKGAIPVVLVELISTEVCDVEV